MQEEQQQCYELWLCAEAGGVKGMNGCAFALTIALLLVEHTSLAHLEASAHVEGERMRDINGFFLLNRWLV